MSDAYENYNKDIFQLIYEPNEGNKEKLRIFGKQFVENIKDQINKPKISHKEKIYVIKEFMNDIDENYNNKDTIKIILKGISNIPNWSKMFCNCKFLKIFSELSQNDMSTTSEQYEFYSELSILDTSNVTDMNWMFEGCNSLISLPDM